MNAHWLEQLATEPISLTVLQTTNSSHISYLELAICTNISYMYQS